MKYKIGYTLKTKFTKGWDHTMIAINDETENKTVYENFNEEDQGRSRVRICFCPSTEVAEFVAEKLNMADNIQEAVEKGSIGFIQWIIKQKSLTPDWQSEDNWFMVFDGRVLNFDTAHLYNLYLKSINQ